MSSIHHIPLKLANLQRLLDQVGQQPVTTASADERRALLLTAVEGLRAELRHVEQLVGSARAKAAHELTAGLSETRPAVLQVGALMESITTACEEQLQKIEAALDNLAHIHLPQEEHLHGE